MATTPPPVGPSRPTRSLIINSPYVVPTHHWIDAPGQAGAHGNLALVPGRRAAGYEIFDTRHNTRRTAPLELVAQIRQRVDAWRAADYPGVTTVTRQLLEHWHDRGARTHPFYFCQLEAIETLIWWVEAPAAHRQGIAVPGDGGAWERLCAKMATGAGKTAVMAMVITWQVLNALTYPKEKKWSRAVLVVAPGVTVRQRLAVLQPGHPANVYDEFALCPSEALRQRLNGGAVQIMNWHQLMPRKEPERSVRKLGAESDKAFARRVLGELGEARDLLVINDEAHHAYRIPAGVKVKAAEGEVDPEEATRWIAGLDRLHGERRIRRCVDLSATPFTPSGNTNTESAVFPWVISDFGLNDAIEAGLVKTPRVVVRDGTVPNAQTLKAALYHLYREDGVADDLNRRGAAPHEPLPELVQTAYTLLGADWRATAAAWKENGHAAPPVLLTVCNKTETAARVEHYFDHGGAHWPELAAPSRTLRVDSKVLAKAEQGEKAGSDVAYEARLHTIVDGVADAALAPDRKAELKALPKEELLRAIIDNVGRAGSPGQDLQNVVSVAMLSEGWDARNVTHILGLRAFTSQLLCEQVIGRGLRRVSHDLELVPGPDGELRELLRPEYVNVFGVPLSIFQDVDDGGEPPPPPRPTHSVESLPARRELELRWPNVVRLEPVLRRELVVDFAQVPALTLDPAAVPISAELAPALGGAEDLARVTAIDLAALPEEFRLQRLVFRAAHKALLAVGGRFGAQPEGLLVQLIRLVETMLGGAHLIIPSAWHDEPVRRRVLIALSLDRIVGHLLRYAELQNRERVVPVFDELHPVGSTAEMRTWYTAKRCHSTVRSQLGAMVADSAWEQHAANVLETSPDVVAYAKNDHLGFEVHYLWNGARRRYVPDFLIKLRGGVMLVLEVKGQVTDQSEAKHAALLAWCEAVTTAGGFGEWRAEVVSEPAAMQDALARHAR
jgi:type III restriction enzyme